MSHHGSEPFDGMPEDPERKRARRGGPDRPEPVLAIHQPVPQISPEQPDHEGTEVITG